LTLDGRGVRRCGQEAAQGDGEDPWVQASIKARYGI
jgi:hypothetical protein